MAGALAAGLAVGCGDSSTETGGPSTGTEPAPGQAPIGASAKSCDANAAAAAALRATGITCDEAREVLYGWQREPACALPRGASRGSCLARSYRCQSVHSGRGLAVSCAREDQSIAFLAKP